ncbi:MAG: uracil-DNA glycosylase [Burkholderiaceae bacterium]
MIWTAIGARKAGTEPISSVQTAIAGGMAAKAALPAQLQAMVRAAHVTWQPVIERGLHAVGSADPSYLPQLLASDFLPNGGRLFAAFAQPADRVRHVLVGEGPFPRVASATGVCFMDGAVESLWSDAGLSKSVNRATSLRNFIKMLLVADGQLSAAQTSGAALAETSAAARAPGSWLIPTLADLQANLHANGFLLLNAALAFRSDVPAVREARAWAPFLQVVLEALAIRADEGRRQLPILVLWGKIASRVQALPVSRRFPRTIAEHPYNLSFITNSTMHCLFRPMHLMQLRDAEG